MALQLPISMATGYRHWGEQPRLQQRDTGYLQNDGSGRFKIIADLTNGSVPGFIGRNGRLPNSFVAPFWTQFLDADGDGDPDLYMSTDATPGF